jgi:Putative peptidoglycan binding domain
VRKLSALEILADRLGATYRALVRVRLPRIFGVVLRNPRDSLFAVLLVLAVTAVVANSLYLQPGPHPAPIFAIRPLPVIADGATGTVGLRRGWPEVDPVKHEPALKSDQASKNDLIPLPRPRGQGVSASVRPDATADAASPSPQISAVQRTLNHAGYGPIKVNGILDDSTREGIARFERDHNLPVTGQNTARVRHALSVATGRSLE